MTYINGGEAEDDGLDRVGRNPTRRARKSSARTRRKKDRRLFGDTPWAHREEHLEEEDDQ